MKKLEEIANVPYVKDLQKSGWYISNVSYNKKGKVIGFMASSEVPKDIKDAMVKANKTSDAYDLAGMAAGPFFPRLHNAGYYLNEKAQQLTTYVRNLVHYKK